MVFNAEETSKLTVFAVLMHLSGDKYIGPDKAFRTALADVRDCFCFIHMDFIITSCAWFFGQNIYDFFFLEDFFQLWNTAANLPYFVCIFLQHFFAQFSRNIYKKMVKCQKGLGILLHIKYCVQIVRPIFKLNCAFISNIRIFFLLIAL